jgi:hypothetical protein
MDKRFQNVIAHLTIEQGVHASNARNPHALADERQQAAYLELEYADALLVLRRAAAEDAPKNLQSTSGKRPS